MSTGMSIVMALLVLAVVIPIGAFFIMEKRERKVKRFKTTMAVNIASFFTMMIVAGVVVFSGQAFAADAAAVSADGLRYIGAALAVTGSTIGAGLAVGKSAAAALGAISENEGMMGKALIFVALAEGVAIYGLIIAIMILNA